MLELDDDSRIIKKLLLVKEICSWLPPGLDGPKVCSQSAGTPQHEVWLYPHHTELWKGLGFCDLLQLVHPKLSMSCMLSRY